jgi:transposase, IS30 family
MKNYTQLTEEERVKIFELRQLNHGIRSIARELNRDKGTISREIIRNGYSDSIEYLPDKAHAIAQERKYVLPRKIDQFSELKNYIFTKLQEKWSPDVIAAKSKEDVSITISSESIYQYCYDEKNKSLGWYLLLASKRKKRLQAHARKPHKEFIPRRTSIHERPEIINQRLEFGHFEGDLTFCKGNRSVNLLVLTERVTQMSFLIKNSSKHATEVGKNCFNALAKISSEARKTITFDNGLEFVNHTLLMDFLNMDTYFCDKHSPWQKGQVEKTNAMLHRFIPKSTSLSGFDEFSLMQIQNQFNNIPRKILGYKTPAELFNQYLGGVALRT